MVSAALHYARRALLHKVAQSGSVLNSPPRGRRANNQKTLAQRQAGRQGRANRARRVAAEKELPRRLRAPHARWDMHTHTYTQGGFTSDSPPLPHHHRLTLAGRRARVAAADQYLPRFRHPFRPSPLTVQPSAPPRPSRRGRAGSPPPADRLGRESAVKSAGQARGRPDPHHHRRQSRAEPWRRGSAAAHPRRRRGPPGRGGRLGCHDGARAPLCWTVQSHLSSGYRLLSVCLSAWAPRRRPNSIAGVSCARTAAARAVAPLAR